ncbi:MAG: hypothetical protein DMG60_00775 [Acidobacteria bacterium]|nr:MAG: hypothetical protein DMG60_00775 [Acidobacteriota bacterium]
MVIALLIGFHSTAALAQVAGGTLQGSVIDSTGAALPAAQVTATNVATGVVRDVRTNRDGVYTLPNLEPGEYELSVEAKGFAILQQHLKLDVGAVRVINFNMKVGALTEKVEVSTTSSTVELGSSEISGVIGSTRITELPLNGRDWTQLATLEPGVSSIRTENSLGNRVQQGEGQQMSISGGRPWQNNYRLDGISINDYANGAPGSALGVNLGVDAVQEFSVVSNGYPAEYGRSSGGIVNAITRSGTNSLHGSAYEFLRNSALDARNYFDTQKPAFRRNQFGGSVGGPIRRDKTFFFGDFEGIRQTLGTTQISNVPSAAARAGNLSTGKVTVDPNVLKFINAFFPLPNAGLAASGDTGKYRFAGPQITSEDFFTGKVDHHISEKDTIDGTYLFDRGNSSQPDELNNKLFGFSTKRNIVTAEENHTFSSQFLNAARLGFNRVVALEGQTPAALNAAAGDPAFGTSPGLDAAQVSVPGLVAFSGGLGGFSQHNYHYNSFQGNDDAFLTRGIHGFKFGASFERIQDNEFAVASPDGQFKFGSLANFLTNKPKSFQGVIPGALSERGIRESLFGVYFQDDMRLRRNLTFNLGLRYEMSTVPSEVNGKLATLRNLTDTTPHLGSPFFSNPTLKNFEPRVGLSWDPFGTGKTAVRAGFGMFDVLPLPYLFELVTEFSAPFFQQGNITSLPAGTFPTGAFALITANSNTLRSAYVQPNPSRNYVMHWNLNLQQQIAPSVTAMVAYVGSHGVHQVTPQEDMDTVVPTLTSAGLLYPANGTRLNPNFGRIGGVQWIGSSEYNALETKVVKQMSHGLQVQGSYTWSKSLDTASTSVGTDAFGNSLTNPQYLFPRLNRGLSDFDVRHNALIHLTWDVGGAMDPKVRALSTSLLRGWEVGSILQVSSGIPFNAILGGDPTGQLTANAEDLPDRVASPACKNLVNPGNPNNYIKLQCLTFPNPVTRQGNLGRNALIGPGLLSLDSSLFKNTFVSERLNIQFRMEAFNIINHTNFAPPLADSVVIDQSGVPVPGAGQITSTQTPSREIQFGLKLIF